MTRGREEGRRIPGAPPHSRHRGSGAQLGRDREDGPGLETLEEEVGRS